VEEALLQVGNYSTGVKHLNHAAFLFCRHLNLSQTVTLTIITAGDALERARLLRRYIDVAQLLQSIKYGNLFSFISIMQGLAAPQVCTCPVGIPALAIAADPTQGLLVAKCILQNEVQSCQYLCTHITIPQFVKYGINIPSVNKACVHV
jgi:hypothetical protein